MEESPLTDRQREILQLIANGCTDKMVADHLGLTTNTIHSHMSRILRALNALHRAHAVAKAFRMNLIN